MLANGTGPYPQQLLDVRPTLSHARTQVWDPEGVIIIPDHYIFTSDPRANRNVDILRCPSPCALASHSGVNPFSPGLIKNGVLAELVTRLQCCPAHRASHSDCEV